MTFGYYLVPSITCHHCLYCAWYDTCLLSTSPSPTTKNHKHTYDSVPRLLCATAPPPPSKPPQAHHSSSTAAVPGTIPVCCTRHHHPQRRITNTPTTAYRACCVRDRASSSHKRDSRSTTTIENTTGTPHQQHSSKGGGDLTSPATVYVADLKNTGKRQNKTYQFNINYFSKTRRHNGRPLFLTQLFLEPQNYKNNRQK